MDEVDHLIALLQNELADNLIILLPSQESSEVILFYSHLKAVIDPDSSQPTFFIQSVRTGDIVGWGREETVIEAIISAYTAMQSYARESDDYHSAA